MGMILTPELYTTDVQPSFTHPPPIAEACKLVLIVRTDLRMSTGKVAAQCVHAALGVLEVDASPGTLCGCVFLLLCDLYFC